MTIEVHLGDVGSSIQLTLTDSGTAVNLTGYTVLQIRLRAPSGARKSLTAALVGLATAGVIAAITVAGTLDEEGEWIVQAYLESPTWKGYSSKALLIVYPVIAAVSSSSSSSASP